MIKGLREDTKEKIEDLLLDIVRHYEQEDQGVRETQLRRAKRLKYYWDNFTRIWWDQIAHDWRIWDINNYADTTNQEAYDKPINVFRAYGESIIAALSVLVPAVTCYPDDADNPLDLQTAKAGDQIAKLLYRHNNFQLLWLRSLFIYYTEGMIAAYNYTKTDKKFGTTEEDVTEEHETIESNYICPICRTNLPDDILSDQEVHEFDPGNDDILSHSVLNEGLAVCLNCLQLIEPELQQTSLIVTRIVGKTNQPKSSIAVECYGGLNIKISNICRKQEDCIYLTFSQEMDYVKARADYPLYYNEIIPGTNVTNEYYGRWARLSTQYFGTEPTNTVTKRKCWLRVESFSYLEKKEERDFLLKHFPDGCCVTLINDTIVDYDNENLDDHWTLTWNPLSDFLVFDPLGNVLTSIQDITNDMVSLVLQTIEHGIPQTFADPAVLNLNQYSQVETVPGTITAATPRSGKSLNESFYEIKTAALSGETLPFTNQIQEYGQLVSGANPTLFGGDVEGSKTASQYSMARQQSLQRLGIIWKLLINWYKEINGKLIPAYIKTVQEDQRFVEKDDSGNFINQYIRYAELQGKIGSIELEANENIPLSWAQIKDSMMQLLTNNNPIIQQWLLQPENLPLIQETLGFNELYVPGEDSRIKQYEEIKILLESQPIQLPPTDEMQITAALEGIQAEPIPSSSIEVDLDFDNHQVELETCKKWINSLQGQLAKVENPAGYQNVLLHAKQHMIALQQLMVPPPVQGPGRAPKAPNKQSPTPIKEDTQNVNA